MSNSIDLENKTVIVTGAARGLGRALAERTIDEGCKTTICDINYAELKRTADEIGADFFACCDVTSSEECVDLAEKVIEKFGKIDYLISNAGIVIAGAIDEITPGNWLKVIEVNLYGFFNMARAVVPYMKKQGGGSIVQINSKSGKKGSYKNSAYAASKFGGIGLTQSLALELAPENIRVNAVCPGNLMNSPLWQTSLWDQYAHTRGMTKQQVWDHYEKEVPLGRTCEYSDVANMTMFLLSDMSGYITGQAINVTGGFEMR